MITFITGERTTNFISPIRVCFVIKLFRDDGELLRTLLEKHVGCIGGEVRFIYVGDS